MSIWLIDVYNASLQHIQESEKLIDICQELQDNT